MNRSTSLWNRRQNLAQGEASVASETLGRAQNKSLSPLKRA